MTKLAIVALLILLASQVGSVSGPSHLSQIQSHNCSTSPQDGSRTVVVRLEDIDLSKIGHIEPKGRVQDKDYNELPIVDQLLTHGKESIPYLISKLDDDRRINEHVMDYWTDIRVGDVAHIILSDFFLDYSWKKSTITGVGWREFLECGNARNITGEQCLDSYITRFGRTSLKAKWQRVWDENRDRIYWDEVDRSFRVTLVVSSVPGAVATGS